MIKIRLYQSKDRAKLIEFFHLNTPAFFCPCELADFELFLTENGDTYFVAENDGALTGAGGYHTEKDTGRLSWYIVHPSHHGKGTGRMLLEHSLSALRAIPGIIKTEVRTSQLVYPFYEKSGFRLIETQDDYWCKGMHLYYMELQK